MHEYSLVKSLLKMVEEKARAEAAVAVKRVTIKIGPLAGVDPTLFATAFDNTRASVPLCAHAELAISGQDVCWRCPACGTEVRQGHVLQCPDCGLPVSLSAGDTMILERLELEVPDDV